MSARDDLGIRGSHIVYRSFPQDVLHISKEPAFVAQSDARPTGDQEVAGSSPAGSATFFRRD